MKIVYLVGEDLEGHPGLKQKIENQIAQWRSRGHEVHMVAHRNRIPEFANFSFLERVSLLIGRVKGFATFRRVTLQYAFALGELKKISPDLVYTRYLFPFPGARKLFAASPNLVVEINSDDQAEYLAQNKLAGIFNFLFRRRLLQLAKGMVFVTEELAESEKFTRPGLQHLVLPNGIDTASVPFCDRTGNSEPNVVFIGSPGQTWHGLDKIKLLVEHCRSVTFNIIGPSQEECERFFGKDNSNLICHGYADQQRASELLKQMDVGIGTMALHRNEMNEACTLKVRHYLASGIPVVAGYRDTDIKGTKPFFLELGNFEKNVEQNLDRIETFIHSAFKNSRLREQAREFAVSTFSNDLKESKRVEFFESIRTS